MKITILVNQHRCTKFDKPMSFIVHKTYYRLCHTTSSPYFPQPTKFMVYTVKKLLQVPKDSIMLLYKPIATVPYTYITPSEHSRLSVTNKRSLYSPKWPYIKKLRDAKSDYSTIVSGICQLWQKTLLGLE